MSLVHMAAEYLIIIVHFQEMGVYVCPSAFYAFGAATRKLIEYGSLSSSCQYCNGHVQGVFLA